jgi:CRISPR-associated endonuclease Csn1
MTQNMRYRLALDLGSTSLGWAMIRLNAENSPCAIIKAGSRIYSNGRESAPVGQQGESLAKVRREKRQARRRRDRTLKRKNNVLKLLVRHGLFPQSVADQKSLETLDPYALRAEGLKKELPLSHLGRALFHLSVRRGFKSNRKTDTEDAEQSLMKAAMGKLDGHIAAHKTLGAYLNHRIASNPNPLPGQAIVRAKSHVVSRPNKRDQSKSVEKNDWEFFVRRSMVEAEFDELWQSQKTFHGVRLSELAREEIRREIFFQRKLRPVDPGRCTLLPNRRRAYKAYPVAQALIVIQTVNNLRVLDSNLQPSHLSHKQRSKLTAELLCGRDLTWHGVKKSLGMPTTTLFNLENGADKRVGIEGDQTAKILKSEKYFGEAWLTRFSEILRHQIVWKILNTQDEISLTRWLIAKTGISIEKAQSLTKVQLPSGVTAYSRRVSTRLVFQLQSNQVDDSMALHLAIEKSGLGSHSARSHRELTGELLDALPKQYGDYMLRHVGLNGRIGNPTVHIGLNQLRVVVNALIARYGKPVQIHIELARELKLNAKQREKANEQIKKNRESRKSRRDIFFENFKRNPTDAEMEKLLLWEELNPLDCAARQCPYTGKPIGINALILSSEVQVEHILPKGKTLDDGLSNKTLAFFSANQAKGNKTPFEAFGHSPTIDGIFYDYEKILVRAKQMRKEKYMRFAPNALEWWLGTKESMPEKYLNETRHLSVVAKEYLSLICSDITCTTGQLTALVRDSLHLNLVLNAENRKNRNDHRHHAVDACVIGIIDRSFIQKIATASAKTNHYRVGMMVDAMPLPWPRFCKDVEAVIRSVKVSHKPDHSFEARLFGEIRAYAFEIDGKIVQAKKTNSDKRAYVIKSVVPIHHKQAVKLARAPLGDPLRPYKGYPSEGNYCLEIIKTEQGKWDFEVIPTYVAYQQALKRGGLAHRISEMSREIYDQKLSSIPGKLVMKLVKGDCVAYYDGSVLKLLRLTQINQENGGTFTEIHEGNESDRAAKRRDAEKKIKNNLPLDFLERLASEDPVFVKNISVNTLFKGSARRVTISPIGDLRDPGFKE